MPSLKTFNNFKKTYLGDVKMSQVMKRISWESCKGEIRFTDIEAFHEKMLKALSRRGKPYKPATVNRFATMMKRVYDLAVRDDAVEKIPVRR